MRRLKRKQIAYLKSYMKNPEAASMFATLKKTMERFKNSYAFMSTPPMYIVSPDRMEEVRKLLDQGMMPEPPLGTMFGGIDISESPHLDESTVVWGRRNADGSFEVLGVDKIDV